MKKSFLIVGAIALFVTLGIIVACNKDIHPAEINENNPALKNQPFDPDYYTTCMNEFLNRCDSAYHVNRTAFLQMCSQNDMPFFVVMTGNDPRLIDTIGYHANQMIQDYVEAHPKIDLNDFSCSSFFLNSLSDFGFLMDEYHNIISAIKTYDSTYVEPSSIVYPPIVDTCKIICWAERNNHYLIAQWIICLAKCELQRLKVDAENTFALLVAQHGEIKPQDD